MAQEEKSAPDWERIEADYRAGVLSVREIAASQGITEGAVRKRAKRDEWTRDLNAKIQAKADDLVRKESVRTAVRTERKASDSAIVEANAAVIADVRMTHRSDIRRYRELANALLGEIEVETGNIDLFEELGDVLRSEDDKGQDKRNDIYRKVISSAARIDSMKKLADTLKVLISLEREAYGIESEPKQAGNGDDMVSVLSQLIEKLPG